MDMATIIVITICAAVGIALIWWEHRQLRRERREYEEAARGNNQG